MMRLTLLIYVGCLEIVQGFFDPATIGASIGLGSIGIDYLKNQTYCRWNECCDERSIPGDTNKLAHELNKKLFGQHIVIKQLVPALDAHFSKSKSRKPLVISFHGTPGTGKNYVAEMIASSLYAEGLSSKFVHKYFGRADFPSAARIDEYKERINKDVRKAIADCPRSLFIFDEVDHAPPGVFESLTSLLDYNSHIDRNDNTQAIFIFLSNAAGVQVSNRLGELLKEGTLRENTRLSQFESTLQMAAYNLNGGMQKSSLIESHVIDHFLPFLPMEKKHVYQCIEAEFKRWEKTPNAQRIESIINEIITYDRIFGLFSTTGCKSIEKKVAIEIKLNKVD